MNRTVTVSALAAACVLSLSATAAPAQSYPTRPIRMVIPWPAGGITDVIARGMNVHLAETLGQPIVIDNRPGAGGTLGASIVAKAGADGHTLLMHDIASHCIAASLYPKLPYDTLKDFEPIAMVAGSPMVLIAHPSLKVRTLPELIAIAKSKPKQINYASSGAGSITHLGAVRLERMGGMELTHVPFKGSIPAASSVLNGETSISLSTLPASLPHAKAGRLVLIAVSFPKRSPQIPDVPTIAETLNGYDLGLYSGLWAPKGTAASIVKRLHQQVMAAIEQPKTKEVLAAVSAIPGTLTPPQFAASLARDTKEWGEVVRASGVKVE
ncbi:MAG TPA: tripartite tricarboxylate transporter substrate binding protein [Burkholderiales bacterium]|nr:tripartite tricarboxylate transporter substrate binding protein [Burkholderiales bacterium]